MVVLFVAIVADVGSGEECILESGISTNCKIFYLQSNFSVFHSQEHGLVRLSQLSASCQSQQYLKPLTVSYWNWLLSQVHNPDAYARRHESNVNIAKCFPLISNLVLREDSAAESRFKTQDGWWARLYMVAAREIMMGVGNGVASVIMLTFPSEPCPHADG